VDSVTVIDAAQDDPAVFADLGTETEAFEVFTVVVENQAVVEGGFGYLDQRFVLETFVKSVAADVRSNFSAR